MARRDRFPQFWPTTGENRMTSARLEATETLDAEIARLQARKIRVLAAEWQSIEAQSARIRSSESKARELPLRNASAEYAASGRVSDSTMQNAFERSARIARDFSASLTALSEGRISHAHLLTIAEAGRPIVDPEKRALFEASALTQASRMTPGQLRNALALESDRMQPRTMAERHRAAREERAVRVIDLSDGMAELLIVMPSPLAHGIYDRLTQQAKLIKQHNSRQEKEAKAAVSAHARAAKAAATGGDQTDAEAEAPTFDALDWDRRTADHIRTDLVTDMLLTSTPGTEPIVEGDGPGGLGAIRAVIQVTVPALTLAGEDDSAADLAGRSPIDPDTARLLAGNSPTWIRLLTDPVRGMVCAVDRYHASAEMERFLNARDQHCRFPGCRRPAHRCDLDHNLDYALGGKTEICNLCNLCKRHHVLKTETPWTARQLTGGVIEWTAPTGRVYIDTPPTQVGFIPEPDPPPY